MVKKIVGILSLLFLLIAIGVTFFVVKQQQELRKKAAPATTLSFSPAQKTAKVDETITLNIIINTGVNQISTVQIKAIYDQQYFEAITLNSSAEFPSILAAADVSTPGIATIHVRVPSNTAFSGETIVGTLTLKALMPTTSPVTIALTGSYAQSPGEGSNNAIVLANPALITISNNLTSGQITPTVIPESSPTQSVEPTEAPIQASPTQLINASSSSPTVSTSANFKINTPLGNGAVAPNPPIFSGSAQANSSITVALSPGTVSGAVSTTPSGTWTFTPLSSLDPGRYTATIVMTNPTSGQTQTSNVVFTIAATTNTISPTVQVTPTQSVEAVPVTGSITYTGVFLLLGVILLGLGVIIPMYK